MFQRWIFATFFLVLSVGTYGAIAVGTINPKHFILVLGLDGVSYQLMTKMYEGGYFREFQRPIPMVATFPSISDPNWDHLMHTHIEDGYTKAHFEFSQNPDGSNGKDVGNLINHLTNPPQYEKAFDFKAEGIFQHLMSMTWSETSALFWTESLTRVLLDPQTLKKNILTAFIINTDFLSHTQGEKKLMDYLKELDQRLRTVKQKFEEQYDKTLEIILVSDHGNFYKEPKAIQFESLLKEKGLYLKSTLKEKTDYAYVASEIISFGAFYTLKGNEAPLAQALASVAHVHVAMMAEDKNRVHVYSAKGESEIFVDPEQKIVSYTILKGTDPFDQIGLFKNKKELSFEKYFFKTLNSKYPNALVRAWEGFHKNAKFAASVLVSPQLGYVFSSEALELLTALSGIHSSHGSFAREETLGMVMSTLRTHQDAITPFEFQDLVRKVQIAH